MHPFMELDDGTVIVYSDVEDRNGNEEVRVYFEKPVYQGFKSAYCILPSYRWENVDGFSTDEIDKLNDFLETTDLTFYC